MSKKKNQIHFDFEKIDDPKKLKQIAKNLSTQLSALTNVLNSIPCSIYWKDRGGVYLGCNKYQAEMAGFDDASFMIGKTDHDFPWKDYAAQLGVIDSSVMRSNTVKDIEETPTIVDGSEIIMLTRKAPLYDEHGRIIGIIGASVDITERKKAEEEIYCKHKSHVMTLERIIELIPGNVYWSDKEGKFLGCNDSILRALNLKSRDECIGKTFFDLYNRINAESMWTIDKEVIDSNIPKIFEEEGPSIESGKLIYLTHKIPLHDNQGNVFGLLSISFDITERKQMEKALQEANEKALIEYNQLKNDFILNMEHDIRTPTSGISKMVEILAEQESHAERKEILMVLAKSAKQLYHLLNDIITFNKIVNVSTPILYKPFRLSELIDNIIDLELPAAKLKDLEVMLVYQEGMPQLFIGDEFRIGRILLNLVSNAIKFTSKGLVKISVKVIKQIDVQNILLSISIRDTGIGIPEEKINFLYEDFTRGELSRQSKYKGAGLGLKIVKNFMNDIGGEILVKSEVDKGTTFSVMLPLKISLLNNSTVEDIL